LEGDALLSAIRIAIDRSCAALRNAEHIRALRDSYATLSGREREVMALIVAGRMNKQAGGDLGISEITVKAHRGRMMRKMNADSLPELVRMAERLCLTTILKGRHGTMKTLYS
jgi:FixJ family two-component response regulator